MSESMVKVWLTEVRGDGKRVQVEHEVPAPKPCDHIVGLDDDAGQPPEVTVVRQSELSSAGWRLWENLQQRYRFCPLCGVKLEGAK